LFEKGYACYQGGAGGILGLPIEQWSTKTLAGRWSASVGPTLDARLRPHGEDQLIGRIANRTGVRLEDCVLLRGKWSAELTEASTPRTLRTVLTSAGAGDDPNVRKMDDGTVLYDPLSIDVARIAKLMMFYEAIGGDAYAGVPNRYQGFVDLSRLLKGDAAILLARAPAEVGSFWSGGKSPPDNWEGKSIALAMSPAREAMQRKWTYYRFIIPLDQTAEPAPAPTPKPPTPNVLGPSLLPEGTSP
jgi:hypothetical protein